MRRPLVLTGGPAAGKTTTGKLLAQSRSLCAFIDVDDLRHFIVSGHAAPWSGAEGLRQQRLGVQNGCAAASNLHAHGVDVVLADLVTPETLLLYRSLLGNALVVRLTLALQEAQARAATRPRYITDPELAMLHSADRREPPPVEHHRPVDGLTVHEQVDVVERLWAASDDGR